MKLEPFRIDVPQAQLDDLRERLTRTRFPEPAPGDAWEYGTDLAYLRDFVAYWRDDYDWRAREVRMNQFEQLTTEIDGTKVHFLHVRSPEPDALPLVITHGWPGSVVEFLDVIGPLADPRAHGGDPADAFHVVAPSLPGYAFSGPTHDRGWHPARVARAWAELMSGLGYSRYVAQGGDWGSIVTIQLALADPEHCAGIHVNMLAPIPMTEDHAPDEDEAIAAMAWYNEHDSGYFKEQSTKPQTVGYALDDSPAGLAAWIVEKFRTWSDCEGDVERSFTKDQLLDNLMLYWLTGTAHSSARMYYEFTEGLKRGEVGFDKPKISVGYTKYPKEIMRTSRRWAEMQYDLGYYAEMSRGGHFAAMEVPDLFTSDLRAWKKTIT